MKTDPIIENRYTRTREFHKEVMRHINLSKAMLTIMAIVVAAILIMVIPSLINPDTYPFDKYMIVLMLFSVTVITAILIKHIRLVKISYQRDMEINNDEPFEARVILTNEGVNIYSGDSDPTNQILYRTIKKVSESKNYYYMITETKLYIAFKKDGFVIGTPDEFLAFLRHRGFRC